MKNERICQHMPILVLLDLWREKYRTDPFLFIEKQKELAIRLDNNQLSENEKKILFLNVRESKEPIDRSLLLSVLNHMSKMEGA